MTATREPDNQRQFLTFHLAGEEYAIGILHTKEIIEYDVLTQVPQAPPAVLGVINLRGSVVPVVDLAVKFGLPRTSLTGRACIVIVEVDLNGERTVMGVIADAVGQVVEYSNEDIQAPPEFGTRVRADFLLGMARAGRKFLLILDINRLLTTEEILSASAALAAAQEKPTIPEPPTARAERATLG
jgi:purine-binding chemotaxis protein CheW